MTTPGPWTPPGSTKKPMQGFTILDVVLGIVMIMSTAVGAFAVLFIMVEGGDPETVAIAVSCIITAIMSALGRVVIHIARTLDRISENGM